MFPPRVQKACSTPKSDAEYVFGNEVSGLDFENVSIELPAGLLGRCQDGIKKESTVLPEQTKIGPKDKKWTRGSIYRNDKQAPHDFLIL